MTVEVYDAFRAVSDAIPEEMRGDQLDTALAILHSLTERKVWLVLSWMAYEGSDPEGVFSSEEKARDYISEMPDSSKLRQTHTSPIIFSNPDHNTGYSIIPMTLDNPEA
jgi:hypothetical protein